MELYTEVREHRYTVWNHPRWGGKNSRRLPLPLGPDLMSDQRIGIIENSNQQELEYSWLGLARGWSEMPHKRPFLN